MLSIFPEIFLYRELGIGIVAYSPLGHGFFGGKAVVESLPNGSLIVSDWKQNLKKSILKFHVPLYRNFFSCAVTCGIPICNRECIQGSMGKI